MKQEKIRAFSPAACRDAVRGCLIGGGIGDALGYPVEFTREYGIFEQYGRDGIQAYVLHGRTKKAIISDDTQMTLFTADGLLRCETRRKLFGAADSPHAYVAAAYQDWLLTQEESFDVIRRKRDAGDDPTAGASWLLDVPELFYRRAPGVTCLNALWDARRKGEHDQDYIAHPRNGSKGCGGVMRVAPVALAFRPGCGFDAEAADLEAAQAAAVTHGHSLGYMPAATLCHIIHRIVYPEGARMPLKDIVLEAGETTERLFAGDKHLPTLRRLLDLAVELSENRDNDLDNIHRLGEGWISEEALAIAVYCALRYQNDFSRCMIVSVNHKGDSDSTGAIAGNILGAWVGYDRIEERWKKDLELRDVILELADDLCFGCPSDRGTDPAWESKYILGRAYRK